MSKATFQIAYAGEALEDGTMDVCALAAALLAVGQLFDDANQVLNGGRTKARVHVRSVAGASFQIDLVVVQSLLGRARSLVAGDAAVTALNLKELLFGGAFAGDGLIWLIKRLRGGRPDRVERTSSETIRLTFEQETFEVPIRVLALYRNAAVRSSVENIVRKPLEKTGIRTFRVIEGSMTIAEVEAGERGSFRCPEFRTTPVT